MDTHFMRQGVAVTSPGPISVPGPVRRPFRTATPLLTSDLIVPAARSATSRSIP